MKVNNEVSSKRKKRKHEDTKELSEDIVNKSNEKLVTSRLDYGTMNLIKSHYKLFEDVKEFQRKKLKLVKESLLNSLQEPDKDDFQLSASDECSNVPQKDWKPHSRAEREDQTGGSKNIMWEQVHKRIENLSAEQDERIKQIYKERYNTMRNVPLISMKEAGSEASLGIDDEDRYPLVFPDIEELLSHVQYNRHVTRWLQIKRGTKLNNCIIVSVEGPGLEEFSSQEEDCPSLSSYKIGVEFVSPLSYGDTIEHAFASKLEIKPPSKLDVKQGFQNMKSCSKKDGFLTGLDSLFNIKWGKNKTNKQTRQVETPEKSILDGSDATEKLCDLSDNEAKENYEYCIRTKQVLPVSLYKRDNFSRLELLMSPREMANEKYPLPFLPRFQSFVKTKEEYNEVTERSAMFGLDCEMCETTAGSELTRISIVNEQLEVVYEKLVKPHNKIVNYLTKYSGITASMLVDVKTRLSDVQSELRTLLPPDAILVGQSLNCDLIAMQMMHPYVIDTSLIFNLSGARRCKAKLKTLCAEFLCEIIQSSKKGHDSIEDACAALKLVQAKLSHSLEWGDAVLGFKRTEEESCKANLELRGKRSQPTVKMKPRLAFNGMVDDASRFQGPAHQGPTQQYDERLESEGKLIKRRKEDSLNQDEATLNGCDFWPKRKKVVEEDVSAVEKPQNINFIYSEVAIIGSKEVRKMYKANLSESARERVTFFKAKSSKEGISKVLELDSQGDKRRLIIAHLTSPCVCQVEKWSAKLKSETKDNDLICISMCGSKGSNSVRGAFFATLPVIDNLPPIKQVVQDYLESCGHEKAENIAESTQPLQHS